MPRTKLPDYQIDHSQHFYRFRDALRPQVWWWKCTCSQTCWNSKHFPSKAALLAHQRSRGTNCCPIDHAFVPPVHADTVEVESARPRVGCRGTAASHTHPTCFQRRSLPGGPQKRALDSVLDPGEGVLSVSRDQESESRNSYRHHTPDAPGLSQAGYGDTVSIDGHSGPPLDMGGSVGPTEHGLNPESSGEDRARARSWPPQHQDLDAEEDALDHGNDPNEHDHVLPHDWMNEDVLWGEDGIEQDDCSGSEEGAPAHDAQDEILHGRMVRMLRDCRLEYEVEEDDEQEQRGWSQAKHKRLLCSDPDSQLVSTYAYDHLRLYRSNVQSKRAADAVLRLNATRQFPSKGCEHWWTFMSQATKHYKECDGCQECRCPHCGATRLVNDKKKGVRGRSVCWLFCDAFQTMMLDPELAEAVLKGQSARNDQAVPDTDCYKPSIAKYKEGERLRTELPKCGYDLSKVLFFDVAFDGLQMGKKYTVNMYIIRCRDTPANLAVNTSNVHLLMLIPGPKDPPQGFAAYTNLMLHLFHAYSPKSDASEHIRHIYVPQRALIRAGLFQGPAVLTESQQGSQRAPSQDDLSLVQVAHMEDVQGCEEHHELVMQESSDDAHDLSDNQSVGCGLDEESLHPILLQPVLTGITCDWPGRTKITQWLQHNAQFNGGWCMCNQHGTSLEGPPIHGYTQEVPQPFLHTPFIPPEQLQDVEPKWWTAEGIERRREALLGLCHATHGGNGGESVTDSDSDSEDVDMSVEESAASEDRQSSSHAGSDQDVQYPCRRVYDPDLFLGDEDLEAMGSFCHDVQQALQEYWRARDKTKLQLLGIDSVAQAKMVFRLLGRKGRLPWSTPFFKWSMPWIRPTSIMLLPPAHMLLHGLCKTFLSFSFGLVKGWSTSTASEDRPLILSKTALARFKVDWDSVQYPHGKGSLPRNPAENVLTYKMEEVGDLLWIGGLAATYASDLWRMAWSHLRAACQHYLFGFNATEADCKDAHCRLYSYAELCEEAVRQHQAPQSLLTPNLHAAICRLLKQERQRGPVALESEWWMERFFLEAKCLVAGLGRVAPEVTYLKSCILLDRTLKLYRARFPSVDEPAEVFPHSAQADPNQAKDKRPFLKGSPIAYTKKVATMYINRTLKRDEVPVEDVVQWCVKTLLRAFTDPECEEEHFHAWRALEAYIANDTWKVLSAAQVTVFHRCQMPNFLVSSELSCTKLLVEGKSEASSYCLANIYTDEDDETKLLPCFVKYFILMQWRLNLPTSRMAVVCPVEFVTLETEEDAFGQTVFRFDKNDLKERELKVISVHDIIRPLILIKTPPDTPRCMWRLVQFQGKLLGTFNESDYWE